jgi:hypothetical protein
MDLLDIPPEVQLRVGPKAEETKAEELPKTEEQPEVPAKPEKEEAEKEEAEEDEDVEPEEEPVAAQEEQHPQKIDKRQKRINRLTRKKAELETQLDTLAAANYELRKKLEEGQAKAAKDQPVGLTGGLLPEIQAEIDKCDAMLTWCDEHTEGGEIGEGNNAQYYDPATIRGWRRTAETTRQEKVVEKKEELWRLKQARLQADADAYQLWPEMFDKSKPEFQEAVSIVRQYPFLVSMPEANLVIGTFLEGRKNIRTKLAPSKNGQPQKQHRDLDERVFSTPRVPIAPHTPEPPTRESKSSSQKRYNEAMSRLVNDPDGGVENLAEALAAREAADRTRPTTRSPVKS